MKKLTAMLGVVAFILVAYASDARACHISFDPEEVQVGADGKGKVTAIVKWEHRKCVLDDDDVNVDTKSVKIIKSTGFKKVKRGLFKNEIEFQLEGKEGSIRVWRECSKKGLSEGIVKIKKK